MRIQNLQHGALVAALCVVTLGVLPVQAATFNIANGDVAALRSALHTANTNNVADIINLTPFGVYNIMAIDNLT